MRFFGCNSHVICSTALAALVFGSATPALAQRGGMAAESGGKSGGYRMFGLSLPVVTFSGDTTINAQFNLAGHATLAIEGMMKGKSEEATAKSEKAAGESRLAKGRGGAIIISRYSEPASMSGFHWGLGAGYREEEIKWRVQPNQADPAVNYTLVDSENKLSHDAELRGATGHARAGYRYAATSVPFIIGAYLGLRHYQPGITDGKAKASADSAATTAPMTTAEKNRLGRISATRAEGGVEIGFVF